MTKSDVPERWVVIGARALAPDPVPGDGPGFPGLMNLQVARMVLTPVLDDLRRQVEAWSDEASRRELADPNAYARRFAYDRVLDLLDTGGSDA